MQTTLELSHLKLYQKSNFQTESSYAALETRPNVLSVAAVGNGGSTRKTRVCGGA
jgi:hypothetical protein